MAETIKKRQREAAKREKKRDKAVRRAERKTQQEGRGPGVDGVDPDLIGIVPGPPSGPD